MGIIELINRIIKIPAGKEVLMLHEDNPEQFLVKVPKKLLTSNIEKSQVVVIAQVGEQIIPKTLEVLFEEEEYVYYQWIISSEYTGGQELIIQFKIVRTVKDYDVPDDVEPGGPEDIGGGEAPPDPAPPEEIEGPTGPTGEEEEPDYTTKISSVSVDNDEEIDPGMMVSIGNDTEGVWYSFQNKFKIEKVLNPLI